jgi:hypothetical protein
MQREMVGYRSGSHKQFRSSAVIEGVLLFPLELPICGEALEARSLFGQQARDSSSQQAPRHSALDLKSLITI